MDLKTYCEKHGQAALAKKLKVTQGLVSQWLKWLEAPTKRRPGATRISAERAKEIELATRGAVMRNEIRPDLFGKAPKRKVAA